VLERFVGNAGQYLHASPWLALVAVFVGGTLTASNPCVLVMIPLMLGCVAGRRDEKPGALQAFTFSLVFVIGLGLAFTGLGMAAALAGKMYGDVSSLWSWVVAAVCLVMGLHLAGIVDVPIPSLPEKLQPRTRGLLGALVLGLLFGVVSAPCAAPLLVVLLTYLAGSGASVIWGGTLLLVYALGHSVLIVLAGTSMGAARALIERGRATRVLAVLRRTAGLLIVATGVYFVCRGFT
jgi:cytochrome c-type biogenesis protein